MVAKWIFRVLAVIAAIAFLRYLHFQLKTANYSWIPLISTLFFLIAVSIVFVAVFSKAYKNWKI